MPLKDPLYLKRNIPHLRRKIMNEELYADIRQIRDGMIELVAQSAEMSTTLKVHTTDLSDLKTQIKTALIPVQFFKWSLVLFGGLSTVGGVIYGIVKGVVFAASLLSQSPKI